MADPAETTTSVETPASSSSASSGSAPTSALAALEKAASASAQPSSQGSGTPGQSGAGTPNGQAATTQPPQTPANPQAQPQSGRGAVPTAEHIRAVSNARAAERADFQKRYGWATNLSQEEVTRALETQRMMADPQGKRKLFEQLSKEMQSSDTTIPNADYEDPRTGAKFYSAETMQKAVAAMVREALGPLQEQIQPLTERQQREAEEAAFVQQQNEQKGHIREALAHAETLPYFKENEAAVSAEMDKLTPEAVNRMGIIGAMYYGYANFMAANIQRLLAEQKEQLHGKLRQDATAANGQVAPSGNQPVARKGQISDKDLAGHMARMAQGAGLAV